MIKKSTLTIVALLLVVLVASLGLLKRYELDLVQGVVVNTILQKAPSDYPAQRIHQVFEEARQRTTQASEAAYLEDLFRLSQRLEKIQSLNQQELDEILNEWESSTHR